MLSEEQTEIIDQEYAKGRTAIEIAKEIGVGKGRVFSYLKESGQIRKGGFKKTISPKQEKEVIDLYLSGSSNSQVADKLEMPLSTVISITNKAGVGRELSESHTIKDEEKQKMAIRLYVDGGSADEVGLRCQVCADTVLKWVRESGNVVRTNMKGKGALEKWRSDKE